LRADPGSVGMCSGVGMHMTKHVFGVYSTSPGQAAPQPDPKLAPAGPQRSIMDTYAGAATIATYTVHHGRDGGATDALFVCDVDDTTRCYATSRDAAVLRALETEEWVGRSVDLVTEGAVNMVTSLA
jgi:acetyl-CoA C-acetyltransferase